MIPIAILLLALAAGQPAAPPGPAASDVPLVSGEFSGDSIQAVAAALSKATGAWIFVPPSVRGGPVKDTFHDTPLPDALMRLVAQSGLDLSVRCDGQEWSLAPAAYVGRPISLNLKDALIDDVFHLIEQVSGVKVVVGPDVLGRTVSINITEVPWDQVLDLIAYVHHLDIVWKGDSVFVSPGGRGSSGSAAMGLGEGQPGITLRIFEGKPKEERGAGTGEVLAAGTLTYVNAVWALDVVQQEEQLRDAFGLAEVRSLYESRAPKAWDEESGGAVSGYSCKTTFSRIPGAGLEKIRVQVSLLSEGGEVGSTEVVATPGRTFTVAGRNPLTGDYVFLSITVWVGPPKEVTLFPR